MHSRIEGFLWLNTVARKKGIGYQTLIRLSFNERLAQEQSGHTV